MSGAAATGSRLSAPLTIPGRLERAQAELPAAAAVFHLGSGVETMGVEELRAEAASLAATLVARGLRPGDGVALLGPNRPAWARWAIAVWHAGGVLVPLPVPLLADQEGFRDHLRAILRTAGCRLVVADPELAGLVPRQRLVPWDTLGGAPLPAPVVDPDAVAVVQFTSGSTAAPKGAQLTHRAVVTAIDLAFNEVPVSEGDVLLSWLPFFHDWGLFGYLLCPLVRGYQGHVLPTERFVADPASWLRLATEVGAHVLPGPPSGWGAALSAAARSPEGIDLGSLRNACLAAELIEPVLVDRLREVGGGLGLAPDAVRGAYGLAEAVLGVTMTAVGDTLAFDEVDRDALAGGGRAVQSPGGKRVASCGPPFPGLELRTVGSDGAALPDRSVGEIWVRGPTVMRGYLVRRGLDDPFTDGWLRTGDLGYLVDGELHVTGRAKDLVIVLGRNIAAEDIEWAAATADGVRRGRCVAFSTPDRDGRVVVVVEPTRAADPATVATDVRRRVVARVGIAPTEVVVAPPGTIRKTTSGKLRRGSTREDYLSGALTRR